MPFKSEKQRKWMWANKPKLARKWAKKKESYNGGAVPNVYNPGDDPEQSHFQQTPLRYNSGTGGPDGVTDEEFDFVSISSRKLAQISSRLASKYKDKDPAAYRVWDFLNKHINKFFNKSRITRKDVDNILSKNPIRNLSTFYPRLSDFLDKIFNSQQSDTSLPDIGSNKGKGNYIKQERIMKVKGLKEVKLSTLLKEEWEKEKSINFEWTNDPMGNTNWEEDFIEQIIDSLQELYYDDVEDLVLSIEDPILVIYDPKSPGVQSVTIPINKSKFDRDIAEKLERFLHRYIVNKVTFSGPDYVQGDIWIGVQNSEKPITVEISGDLTIGAHKEDSLTYTGDSAENQIEKELNINLGLLIGTKEDWEEYKLG